MDPSWMWEFAGLKLRSSQQSLGMLTAESDHGKLPPDVQHPYPEAGPGAKLYFTQ